MMKNSTIEDTMEYIIDIIFAFFNELYTIGLNSPYISNKFTFSITEKEIIEAINEKTVEIKKKAITLNKFAIATLKNSIRIFCMCEKKL